MEAAIKILGWFAPALLHLYLPLSLCIPRSRHPRSSYGLYDPAKVPPLRPTGLPNKPDFYEAVRRALRLDQLTEADFRQIQAVYLGMISYSDWMLGELMAALERTKHDRDTAVFVFSDHGEWGGDFGLVEKWPSACDGVLEHIPLIVRGPGVKAGHVSREIVELYDVMATVLEMAGIEAQHTHFARSLTPQLRGGQGDPKRSAFCEAGYNVYEPQCFEPLDEFPSPDNVFYPKVKLQNEHPETVTRATMIRTLDFKLVDRPGGVSELYDLQKDPRELHNLYGNRSYTTPQEELHRRMLDWYIGTSDVAPKKHDPRGFPKP